MVYNDTFNFQQYFSYIAVVNSIDGGNQRKPPTRTTKRQVMFIFKSVCGNFKVKLKMEM
jgi:hypothetical protein